MAFVQLDNAHPILIDENGRLKDMRFNLLKPTEGKLGHLEFSYQHNKKLVTRSLAVEVLRHFGGVTLPPTSVDLGKITYDDGDKTNCRISNLGYDSEQAQTELNKSEISKDLKGQSGEDSENTSAEGVETDSEEGIEQTLTDKEGQSAEGDGGSEAEFVPTGYEIIEPESGSYYDIVNDVTGESILDKKLQGKAKTQKYIDEMGIDVVNPEVLN